MWIIKKKGKGSFTMSKVGIYNLKLILWMVKEKGKGSFIMSKVGI